MIKLNFNYVLELVNQKQGWLSFLGNHVLLMIQYFPGTTPFCAWFVRFHSEI